MLFAPYFHLINITTAYLLFSSNIWSKVGHFSKALSKGPNTTTWIWNFHADAHDFDIQHANARKVFASSLAHLSLVFLSIAQIHFHTAYFSSFSADPLHVHTSAHIVYQILNQDILNSDIGCNFQGIVITSGIFQLQHSMALCTLYQLHIHIDSIQFSLHPWILFQNASFFISNSYKLMYLA
jgi:hypothetical protein